MAGLSNYFNRKLSPAFMLRENSTFDVSYF